MNMTDPWNGSDSTGGRNHRPLKDRLPRISQRLYSKWILYSDKSSSIFENDQKVTILNNSNFPIVITCVTVVLMFAAIGLIYCYCGNDKKRCFKTISPEKEVQTKPEKDSNLARTDFELPPAYSKCVELPKTPVFT